MALEHEALTAQFIGAAIEVHRRLGAGAGTIIPARRASRGA